MSDADPSRFETRTLDSCSVLQLTFPASCADRFDAATAPTGFEGPN